MKHRFIRHWRLAAAIAVLLFPPILCLAGEAAASETQSPPIRSAAEIDYPPFSFVDEEGRASGFAVELLRTALAAMGRDVTFRTGPWSEVRGWLEKGEVQALPLVGRTPEREPLFDFTFPYMTLHGAIVVRSTNSDIWDLVDLAGRDVAVMKGDNAEEFLRRKKRGITIHTTATFEEALHDLSKGRYDAVFIQRLVALRLIQQSGITNLKVVNNPVEAFRQDFCFAVTEGDRETLALLNEGLSIVMADGTYRHLHAKWFAALELPAQRRVVVGGDHNFPPFEYLDEHGRPAGYNVDLTRAIAKEVGLDIEIRLGPWAKIREALARGEIDVIQGMFYSPGRDLIFDFSPSHAVNHCVAVVRKEDGPPPETVEELMDRRIVVQAGDIMHDFALAKGLKHVFPVDAQEDALRELAEGKHDCALVSRLTALYWIDRYGWKNLVVGKHPFASPEYCYAVANGKKALLAQFSEGLQILQETGEYRRIRDKWFGVYEEPPRTFGEILRLVGMIVGPLLLILCGFFLWSWSLRRQVAQKTQELKETADRFRFVFESVNVGKSMTLPTGEIDANEAFARFLGYTAAELAGKKWQDITPPEDIQASESAIAPLLEEKKNGVRFEKRYVHKSGEFRWADVSIAVRRDAAGNPLYFLSTVVDISDRKEAEAALRRSEDRLRTLVNTIPDLVWLKDREGVYLSCNSTFERFFGAKEADIVGKTDYDFVEKDLADFFREQDRKAMAAGGPSVNEEALIFAADGYQGTFETIKTPMYDYEGALIGVLGISRDITQRKQAEEALRESEAFQRAMIDCSPVAIYSVDFEGRVLSWNTSAERIFGWTEEEVKGRPLPILPEDRQEEYQTLRERVMAGQRFTGLEVVRRKKDGALFHGSLSAAPIRNSVGAMTGIIAAMEDITVHKQAEQEREKLQDQLLQAQKMESVGRLAGGVAHDYNNMLSVILGYTEMALDRVDASDPLHDDLTQVLSAARRSSDFTRQLLAFARRQTIAPKVLDINETIEAMLKMLRRLIGEDIDLLWKPAKAAWPVHMDPAQLDQILANLCVNARDAISGVGMITIETGSAAFDEAYCADHVGFLPGQYTMLGVSDDGCGMDPETLPHLFEPFFTTKKSGEGTGLGLATVYGIVKQNEGFINVYSEPGKGTTFRIYLPRHAGAAEKKMEKDRPKILSGKGETVLLVEDEPAIMKIGEKMLKSLGYRVLTATSPAEAESLAKEHAGDIHLLVTDVIMPGMNGRELADRLQASYPGLKVLYMSGYTANVIAHRAVLEEGVCFIQKPFSKQALAAKVREALAE